PAQDHQQWKPWLKRHHEPLHRRRGCATLGSVEARRWAPQQREVMPLDTMALAAIADDIRGALGGQIQRILQPSAASVGLAIYAGREQHWLLLSADAHYA